MLPYYFKIALRNILRHKGYSFINVVGLAIGMACCILIFLFVQHELSYDRFNKNIDNIYLVAQSEELSSGTRILTSQSSPFGPIAKKNVPEIVDFTRLIGHMISVSHGENTFPEYVRFADPSLLTTFDFPLVSGDVTSAMSNPNSVVITERAAQKYFGDENPIGKTLNFENKFDIAVTAVAKNVPVNSSIEFEILIPIEFLNLIGFNLDEVQGYDYYTFLQLQEGAEVSQVLPKIQKVRNDIYTSVTGKDDCPATMMLHPLARVHLYKIDGNSGNIGGGGGGILYVRIFIAVAIMIILIACLNFINLSTARSVKRSKEIGLRKVAGANRIVLVKQLLGESFIYLACSVIAAIVLAEIFLPLFNNLSGIELHLSFSNMELVTAILLLFLFTGVSAGLYPAVYLSSFQPVKIINRQIQTGKRGARFRQTLVVVQYTLSLLLIIGTLVVSKQVNYLNIKDIGLSKENIITFNTSKGIENQFDSFKSELLKDPNIEAVTASAQGMVAG